MRNATFPVQPKSGPTKHYKGEQKDKPHVKIWSTYETDTVEPLGQSTYFLGHTSHALLLR